MKNAMKALATGVLGGCLLTSLALAAEADCYAIQNQDKKNICLARTTGQSSYCHAVRRQDARNFCLAMQTSQVAYCYSIRDDDRRKMCLALIR